jgi:hypothetical protein
MRKPKGRVAAEPGQEDPESLVVEGTQGPLDPQVGDRSHQPGREQAKPLACRWPGQHPVPDAKASLIPVAIPTGGPSRFA